MSKSKMLAVALFAVAMTVVNAQNLFVNTTKLGGGPIGYIVYNGPGSYTVYGGGYDIWGSQDEFTFHYYQVTGDFDVRVRVDYVEPVAVWTKAGIMVRETIDNNNRMAFVKVSPVGPLEFDPKTMGEGQVALNYRKGYSGADGEHQDNIASYSDYKWIRLQRVGNMIYGYASQDGETWVGPQTQDTSQWLNNTPLSSTLLLGLAVSRHGSAPLPQLPFARAEFRNFADAKLPPVIIEQPKSQSVAEGSTATFTVDNAGGYDFVTYQWMKNGEDIEGATARTYTTPPVTADDNGSRYSVRITNRNTGASTTSSVAVLNVGSFVLLGATVNDNPNSVVLNFSKPVTETTALNAQNYTVQGLSVTAAAFGQDAKQVILTVTPSMTYQSQYQVTVQDLQESESSSTISPNPSTVTVTFAQGYTPGPRIVRNFYSGTGGNRISQLLANPKYPYSPDVVDYPPYLEDDRGNDYRLDNLGIKMYGWFVPPVSGNYTFYTAGDDENIVYLSTDDNPLNKRQIANQSDWGDFRNYFDDTARPGTVSLVAGKKYYLEVLSVDGSGGGHCSVAVQYPGSPTIVSGSLPIPATMFAPISYIAPNGQTFTNFGPITITKQPSSKTVDEGRSVTFKVEFDGSAPYTVTWYTNDVPIQGVNSKEFTISYTDSTMDGTTVKAKVENSFSSVESQRATLNVLYDGQPPQPIYASGDTTFMNVIVKFDEPVEPSSVTSSYYDVYTVESSEWLWVDHAEVVDSTTIKLVLDPSTPLTPGVTYQVDISGVTDASPHHNMIDFASIQFTAWMMARGYIRFEVYDAGGGTDVETTENYINAGNPPKEVYYIPTFNTRAAYPNDSHDNYGGRLIGYL
ncbi:MAG TPA: PA14 domain-containing protein, partial [Verrucomicrobiota bacterium]|nr:PA14 domain-containing protein [Verrucomicrobiota bacterium]